MKKLIVIQSLKLKTGDEFVIEQDVMKIGRKEGNDIVIPENDVSRVHCEISVSENDLLIKDLGSGNGTMVNHQKITAPVKLNHDDILSIGETKLRFKNEEVKKKEKQPQKQSLKYPQILNKIPKKTMLIILFSLMGFFLIIGLWPKKNPYPQKKDCRELYLFAEAHCKFNHPVEWKRKNKFKRYVYKDIYLEREVLLFGKKYDSTDVLFGVELLKGFPKSYQLKDVFKTNSSPYPRLLPHGKKLMNVSTIDIDGVKAFVGESPVFKNKKKLMKSMEAYIYDNQKRYFLIGFTTVELFEHFRPVFEKMIESFSFERKVIDLQKPDDPEKEVQMLVKRADSLIEKKHLKAENEYLALKDYRQAARIHNQFLYQKDDPKRSELMKKCSSAQNAIDRIFKDLKFQIERGLKVKEYGKVFQAAKEIMERIPDPENPKYKYADRYYLKYSSKYELSKKG